VWGEGYLADEGGEVGVPKVLGEDLLREAHHVDDGEPHVILVPADDLLVLRVLPSLIPTSRIS
jgi:hypothetical protein